MITSVDRIVSGPASDLPPLFEAPIIGSNFVATLWMTSEHFDTFTRVWELESGEFMDFAPDERVEWLQPEDMNSPSVQAELIAALAAEMDI